MKKKYLLLLVLFIGFFSFNMKVDAAKNKDSACVYSVYDSSVKASHYLKIIHRESGKTEYKYRKGEKGKFKKIKKSRVKNNVDTTKSCPWAKLEYKNKKFTLDQCLSVTSGGCKMGQALGAADQLHNSSVGDYQAGNCTYKKDSFSFKIKQKKNGKVVYYYKKSGGDWNKNTKSDDIRISATSKPPFDSCPTLDITNNYLGKYNYTITIPCSMPQNGCAILSGASGDFARKTSTTTGNGVVETYEGDINGGLLGNKDDYASCKEILGKDLIKKIQEIVNIIRIMVPVMLIVFGIMDFGKAIFINDENEMKKCQSKFIKRLIIAVAFFIIPSILQILLNIAGQVWDIKDTTFCGIKF